MQLLENVTAIERPRVPAELLDLALQLLYGRPIVRDELLEVLDALSGRFLDVKIAVGRLFRFETRLYEMNTVQLYTLA